MSTTGELLSFETELYLRPLTEKKKGESALFYRNETITCLCAIISAYRRLLRASYVLNLIRILDIWSISSLH